MALTLRLTGDAEADALLSDDPFALLTGMLLDQQIAMDIAFIGPQRVGFRIAGQAQGQCHGASISPVAPARAPGSSRGHQNVHQAVFGGYPNRGDIVYGDP